MKREGVLLIIIVMILCGFLLGFLLRDVIVLSDGPDYKQGQIDALTGTINVELVNAPDGTRTWEWNSGK